MSGIDDPAAVSTHVEPQEHPRRRKRRGSRLARRVQRFWSRINWLIVAVVVAGIIAAVGMSALVIVTDATNRVWSSWSSLSRVLQSVTSKPGTEWTLADFERLQTSLNDMIASLENAVQSIGFLRGFAPLHAGLAASLDALDMAHDLALASGDMLNGLQPTVFFLVGGEEDETVTAQVSSGQRIVELLRLGRGRFARADGYLDAAETKLQNLSLAGVSPDLLLTVEDLSAYLDQLRKASRILIGAPDLLTVGLGLDAPQDYLILSQNSDELRPSGGYISTFGWVSVRNARIVDFGYNATTPTSPNPPPATFADQVAVPEWWIQFAAPLYAAWDGSWYADFPATAQMAAWYYNGGNNPQAPVDGVIAIDLVGFEYIIEALGSVTVPGYEDSVNAENLRSVIYKIRGEGRDDRAHKRFLVDLYHTTLSNWQNIDRERSADLLGAVLRALQEKHIMLYFADAQLNQAVDLIGWSGAQAPAGRHDYLMVADANLGNKSNRSIIRQLTYDVEIRPDGTLQSRATVAYDYPAALAEKDPAVRPAHYNYIDYYNLLQVFVPPGSVLLNTDNLSREPTVVASEDHTVFVAQTHVAYNGGERFQFTYTTPVTVESVGAYRRYRLLLQKQPGMIGETVSVQVRLPAEAEVIDTSPEAAASYELDQPIVEFRATLVTDQWIDVIYTTK